MSVNNKTLIIDGQLFQSYTFHRGMGKYSLSLLKDLNDKLPQYKNKVLVFNNISGYLSEDEMELIKSTTPGFSYEFLDFKHIADPDDYEAIKVSNKTVIDAYIAKTLPDQKIDYLILSLFQETEISVFPTDCNNKYLLIYDLIPIQFFDPYLKVESVAKNYLKRFDSLVEADHFFTISQSVASDLALLLGVPKSRITPIYGAPVKRTHLDQTAVEELVDMKFILLPSGDDYRKNNDFAVKAFELFIKKENKKYKLAITSSFTEATKERLIALSANILFLGNVSESQLAWLYGKAECVYFPSQSEGLGLPILEAIEFSKPVVCSDIPVFREISEKGLVFCDPYSVEDMTRSLDVATNSKFKISTKDYKNVLKKYSWDLSAQLVADTLRLIKGEVRPASKKNIAIFSPKPDGFSGIGKVVQEQHYLISRSANVTYYFEQGISEDAKNTEIRKNYLKYAAKNGDPWNFNRKDFDQYDKVIYHIGNGEYHVLTLVRALAFPSHVVLHDTRIKGLYNVTRSAGLIGSDRFEAEDLLDNMTSKSNGEFLGGLINKQDYITVHSDYAKVAVEEAIINGLTKPIIRRQSLGIPEPYHVDQPNRKNIIYVAMAGLMTGSKGIDMASSITKIKLENSTLRVKIFGFSMLDKETKHKLMENKNIELVQSPTDTRYLHELSQSTIMLNFRYPYHGETSYSTLEGLRFAKQVIINNNGWFGELPDNIVYKVGSINQALEAVKDAAEMHNNKELQEERIEYIVKQHGVAQYLDMLLK